MRNSSNPTMRRCLEALDFMPEEVTSHYLRKLDSVVKVEPPQASPWGEILSASPRPKPAPLVEGPKTIASFC